MKLFKYYRLAFALSFLLSAIGAILKITHAEIGLINGDNMIVAGVVSSFIFIALAFYMMYQSQKMPSGEKLIWVLLYALGFITGVGIITFLTAVVFFFIGPKRLFYTNNNSTKNT
ncbi:MAG TPA: hypothetical protein VLY87_05535 [Flavobacterium sp.]|nr:hypothetical protein [Flavobacterium sp.]